jgi:hypothetical protein
MSPEVAQIEDANNLGMCCAERSVVRLLVLYGPRDAVDQQDDEQNDYDSPERSVSFPTAEMVRGV